MKTKMILTLILSGALVFTVACDNNQQQANDQAEDDQAEAVEAEREQAENPDDAAKEGGAADEQGAAAQAEGGQEAPQTATVGQPAPDFELTDETGAPHKLSDYDGKIVVLEWTNPECPYVVRHKGEEKTMTQTHEALGEDVVWLAIDSTNTVTAESATEAKDEWGFSQPVLLDASGDVGKMYEAKTTPHMYIIDEEGVLRYQGAIDDDPRGKNPQEERTNYVTEAAQAIQDGEEVAQKESKPYGCTVKYGS